MLAHAHAGKADFVVEPPEFTSFVSFCEDLGEVLEFGFSDII